MSDVSSVDDFMSVAEVAAALGIVRQTVYRWIELGRITPAGRIGDQQVFLRSDIEDYRSEIQWEREVASRP